MQEAWSVGAWSVFAQQDVGRRNLGRLLEGLGWGAVQSRWRVIFHRPGCSVRAYTEGRADRPAVLLIPAPIKQSYIWDLAPGCSVVRKLVQAGMDVYLVDWDAPDSGAEGLGLADYGGGMIQDCVRAVAREGARRRIVLAGHSVGGTFAALFAAVHGEGVAGLILCGAPLHFGVGIEPLSRLVAASPPSQAITGVLGNVPGSVLDVASLWAAPGTFLLSRWLDWLASLPDPQALGTHLRVERWTLDEMALPRQLFEEVMEQLYREDRFARGVLEIAGQPALPEQIRAPLLVVVEEHSAVAPPASVGPVFAAARSREKRWLRYPGDIGANLQHVGMLVGATAHERLWPEIAGWIHQLPAAVRQARVAAKK